MPDGTSPGTAPTDDRVPLRARWPRHTDRVEFHWFGFLAGVAFTTDVLLVVSEVSLRRRRHHQAAGGPWGEHHGGPWSEREQVIDLRTPVGDEMEDWLRGR